VRHEREDLTVNVPVAPVQGLILAGGRSSRMRRDKAVLEYGGETQLERAFALAARHVEHVFVSVRADQAHDPSRAGKPLIVDAFAAGGPIDGIRSAFARSPDAAWLVLACDLPFLSDAAIEQLLRERDPTSVATAFRSVHDGLPEPLCAIWEPAAAALLDQALGEGIICPRKFLIRQRATLLEPRDRGALENVNTPDEYAAAQAALETAAAPLPLNIQYYALLREQAGRSNESLLTRAATPAALYRELAVKYPFTLALEQLKVAINGEFSEWTRTLRANDAVVFIPPVAGG
jgi:molybdopterin-guanine dinucleotide biosynthesis protein A